MKPLMLIAILITSGVFLLTVYWIYAEMKAEKIYKKNEYELTYKTIQHFVNFSSASAENYDTGMNMLEHLGQLPYKNKEKTIVLTNQFFIKFQCERIKRLLEN
jgi:hypothetical protein